MAEQAKVFGDKMKEALLRYDRELQLDQYQVLNVAHEKTHQPRIYIVLAVGLIAACIIVQLLGLSFISNLFAFVPIYASFKALRSVEKEDDELWLTYWVVYGSLGLFESFFDVIFFWMPFYYIAKIVFLIWAFHPATRGAQIIYHRFLGPLFGTLTSEIEQAQQQAAAARAAKRQQ